MRLSSVRIRSMPGLPDGLEIDGLGPGLNVVLGPNGIGKTSLCRAIRHLLWGVDEQPIAVEALWDEGDRAIRGDREGARTEWQVNGRPEAVALPPEHLADCFTVRIDQLLPEGANDESLARQIAREMAGGYDLKQACGAAAPVPPGTQALRTRYRAADEELSRWRSVEAALVRREAALRELRAQRAGAERAARDLQHLETALALAGVRERLAAIEVRRAAFPGAMHLLREGDGERLEGLQKRSAAAAQADRDAEGRASDAAEAVAQCRLPGDRPIPDDILDAWARRVAQLVQSAGDVQTAESGAAAAEGRLKATQAALAGGTPSLEPRITPDRVAQAEGLLVAASTARARAVAEEMGADILRTEEGHPSPTVVQQGVGFLAAWLRMADHGDAPGRSLGLRAMAVLFVLALAGGVVAALTLHRAFATVALLGAAGLLVVFLLVRSTGSERDRNERDVYRREYEGLGLTAPASWSSSGVEKALADLAARLGPAALAAEKAARLAEAQPRVERARRELAQAETACRRFTEETAIGLGGGAVDTALLIRNLADHQAAVAAVAAAREVRDVARSNHDARLGQVNEFFAEYPGCPPAADAEEAQARVQALRVRSQALAQADADRTRALAAREAARDEGQAADDEIAALFADRCASDEAGFRACFERLPDWTDLEVQARAEAALMAQLAAQLEGLPELQHLTVGEARSLIERTREDADRYASVTQEIAAIEAEVRAAKGADNLERAGAAVAGIREEIAARREQALLARATGVLLEAVERDHGRCQPEVLRRASDLFERFTGGAYVLDVDRPAEGAPRYRAFERDTGRGKPLSELSGGTRVQLLLAARMAFAEQAEAGLRLPLFLDETLKHSDPERYQAIGECLRQVAAEGRQVFYLTNDPADVARLERAFDGHGEGVTVIDLAAARRRAAWYGDLDTHIPPLPPLPEPDGLTVDDYARAVGASRLDPRGPASAVHVVHMLPGDLTLVHTLLKAGVSTLGRWRDLSPSGRAHAGLDPVQAAEIDAWASVTQAFLDAWQEGRGELLTREALGAAGVSGVYLDRVWQIARENRCDASLVLPILRGRSDPRVAGFQARMCDRVAAWLLEEGYLVRDLPLDEDGVCGRVLGTADTGALTPERVRERVHTLWVLAGRREDPA